MPEKDPFLKRWSRQKLETKTPDDPQPVAAAVAAGAVAAPADGDDTPPPAPEPELPDIDKMDAHSDYTAFLGQNVPIKLARLALRKLWRSDPVLANVDGLNDYDEDFSIITPMRGAVETALSPAVDGERASLREDAAATEARPAPDAAGAPEAPGEAEAAPQPQAPATAGEPRPADEPVEGEAREKPAPDVSESAPAEPSDPAKTA